MSFRDEMLETATLAGGCFWCTEAIFARLKGVTAVIPGYTGGTTENPTYEQVCTGSTGHAEAIKITFDPRTISYTKLVEIFFRLHDPTTLNQQGYDIGTEYRSAIFYHSENQKQIAETVKAQLMPIFKNKIVTEIVPYTKFYVAENYHQNYYDKNKQFPYCQYVIDPKLKKLLAQYRQEVKEEFLTKHS